MAYTHQKDIVRLFGFPTAGAADTVLASLSAGIRARYIVNGHQSILREVSCVLNVVSSVAKPVWGIRKAAGPCTVTATGTEIAVLTVPAASVKGQTITRTKINTVFAPGDHLILRNNTAATKALSCRLFAYLEPDWETKANVTTSVTTVTA